MRTFASELALAVAAFAFIATPAAAEFFGCNTPKTTIRNYGGSDRYASYGGSNHYASARTTHEFAAQSSRPRFTIFSRQNRTRYY